MAIVCYHEKLKVMKLRKSSEILSAYKPCFRWPGHVYIMNSYYETYNTDKIVAYSKVYRNTLHYKLQ